MCLDNKGTWQIYCRRCIVGDGVFAPMVSFALSDEERLIQQTAAQLGRQLREEARRAEAEGVPDPLRGRYEEIGFLKLDWPEAEGGEALPFFAKGVVLEALAFGCAAVTLELDRINLCRYLGRGEPAFSPWREALRSSTSPWIYYDAPNRLSRDGNRLQGTIPLVLSPAPQPLAVLKEGSLFLLSEGLRAEPVRPLAFHACGATTVEIEAKVVPAAEGVDERRALAPLWAALSSLLTGIASASYEHARAYTQQREAFGRKIAHHQGVAFILADMAIGVSACRLMWQRSANALATEQGESVTEACAGAFAFNGETALFVTNYGVQLLGGHGYMRDHPVEKWMREARALSLLFGGREQAAAHQEAALLATGGLIP